MQYLTINQIKTLSLGAAFLGSGGGGDPNILLDYIHNLMTKYGAINVISIDSLTNKMLVVPVALIGAPLVTVEKLINIKMFEILLTKVTELYPEFEIVLTPAEIGGCNALTPLVPAAKFSLPVLDGDLIGRAFPRINMCKPGIVVKDKQTAIMVNGIGETTTYQMLSVDELENFVAKKIVDYGCSAVIAAFIFTGDKYRDYIIEGSVTRALLLGKSLQLYSKKLSDLCLSTKSKLIATGTISEVTHTLRDGFLTGYVQIKSSTQVIRVYFQNEYLVIKLGDCIVAQSPTIITLLDMYSGIPVTSESLRFGLKVAVLVLSEPEFWQQPEAYSQVNLSALQMEI